mgnify:CR=1 FL=1|jgi:glycosyltransferase involved in cell wall biosynthesis
MTVDFIIPTYDRIDFLRSMLSSLLVQTDSNWRATVVIDDNENKDIVSLIEDLHNSNIRYIFAGERYNDWGHTPREIGKQQSDCDYIIMTGDDNYYAPVTVSEILSIAAQNPEIIYWDMVHSHYQYSYFNCKPSFNQIDMGAFATRRDIAQSIKLKSTYAADGDFIEEIKRTYSNIKMIKINKVLFVHN